MINQEPGNELYADYPALWHLESIGILDVLRNSPHYEKCCKASRVAIIDTSVAIKHPCLVEAVNQDLAIDFYSNRLGAFPYSSPGRYVQSNLPNVDTDVADDLPGASSLLKELVDRLSPGTSEHVNGIAPTTSADFSNHGTAVAGLVGGRPCVVPTAAGLGINGSQALDIPLPYSGADPFCELVPISTNFDTDPESLILALLYADIMDASVILIPRSFPDPFRTVPPLTSEAGMLQELMPAFPTARERNLWDELAQLIVSISMRRPIVAAAGNGQEVGGIYPANLASEFNGIISVGAVNAKGQVSGFSTNLGITVMGPSNDGTRFDRVSVRLDEQAADYPGRQCPSRNNNTNFSHFEIVSTDVPGRHGYSYSPFESEEPTEGLREFGSYFCRFGGTSAASAIIAGFISLGFSLSQLPRKSDGLSTKEWLISKCISVDSDDGSFLYPAFSGEMNFPGLNI